MRIYNIFISRYFYEKSGTKRWDTCAGEALLKSIGGYLTDLNGNSYEYKCTFINYFRFIESRRIFKLKRNNCL
jgi:fructose-1,6-bisphosphatase/inositol monophosphatase family enzyme